MGRSRSKAEKQSAGDLIKDQFSAKLLRTKHREDIKERVEDRRGHKKEQGGGTEAASPLEQLQAPSTGPDLRHAASSPIDAIRSSFEVIHVAMAERIEQELNRLHEQRWSGTVEQNRDMARNVTDLVKRSGLQLYVEKSDPDTGHAERVPVTVRFHKNVFELNGVGGTYAGSSSNWPLVKVQSKLAEVARDRSATTEELSRSFREELPLNQAVSALSEQIKVAHRPFVDELRGLLTRLHEAKRLESYEENAEATKEVNRLARECGVNLLYDDTPVSLDCVNRKNCKTGLFRLRTLGADQDELYVRVTFPILSTSETGK